MTVSDTRRLKELEAENSKLKKPLAESELDESALKDLLGRNVWSASLLQEQRATDGDRSPFQIRQKHIYLGYFPRHRNTTGSDWRNR
jgi:hypothetical protein